jgi:xanthine dehydrogenase molybdenum-binding subunit
VGNSISIGKRVPSVESYNKATGRTLFTADIRMPRMLYAKMLRSPYAHARIINIDTRRAIKLNGVKAAITYKDVPKISYNSSCPNFFGPQIKLDQCIFDSKVRYAGEEVAAVAAETEEIAEEAIELIEVTYNQLPAILNVEEALKPEAPKIHPGGNIAGQETFKFGDIEKGFKDADRIFEDAYKLSAVNPCPIEPHACICSFDSAGKLKVLSAHQKPFPLRKWLSFALGMPIDKVEIIKPPVGGGFGAKQDMVIEPHCALLSKMTGRPVRMEFTREEQFKVGRRRHSGVVKVKTGVKRDGTMIARQMEALLDTGAYSSHGYNVMFATGAWFATLYKSPHTLFEGKAVYTNTSIAGAMRGFGDPQATFAVESQMDAIAEELGIDPIELRLKNALKQGDPDPFSGVPIATCGLRECLEEGARRIGWYNARKRTPDKGTKRRGDGVWKWCEGHLAGVFERNSENKRRRLRECDRGHRGDRHWNVHGARADSCRGDWDTTGKSHDYVGIHHRVCAI